MPQKLSNNVNLKGKVVSREVTSLDNKLPVIPPLKQVMIEPVKYGYEEFKSILSDSVLIRFSVPIHAWSKLEESKEWKAFQSLLEEYQREYNRKLR